MSAYAEQTTRVVFAEEVVELRSGELDRLLGALAALELRDAEAVGEQIAALRLAGGTIELMPTEAELAALVLALGTLGEAFERE